MAISAVPYALQNGSHSADLFRQAVSSFVPPGGGIVTSGDLTVTQTGTASMNVVFGVGRAWVPGTNVGNVAGGNFSKQAMYFALNDSAFTASIATANATNPRIDVAYLAVQDSQYAGTTNTAVLGIATGVPTAGATYPANAPTIPANAIALAWINVAANAASITNANITAIKNTVLTPSSAVPVATVTGTTGWNLTGVLTKTNTPNGSQVSASFMCNYGATAGAFTITGTFIQALTLNNPGYIPTADVFGYVTYLSSTNVVKADGSFNINPSGQIYVRLFSSSYAFQPTDKFYITANWNA